MTMIQHENPALMIGTPEKENGRDVAQVIGAACYYFTMSWPADLWMSPPEIPPSFEAGLKDISEGRVVDLDIALTQPPGAQIPRN